MAEGGLTAEQIELIGKTLAKDAPEEIKRLFICQCQRTGLDPLSRQIYLLRRREQDQDTKTWQDRWVINVTIDGLRVLAVRSGKYRGQLGPYWCGPDGAWRDAWLEEEPPLAARVGIIRSDFDEPLWAVARYKSYVQYKKDGGVQSFWARMPDVLLAKCAEAAALRRAFPTDLSGLYIPEEMGGHVEETTEESDWSAPERKNLQSAEPLDLGKSRIAELPSAHQPKPTKAPPAPPAPSERAGSGAMAVALPRGPAGLLAAVNEELDSPYGNIYHLRAAIRKQLGEPNWNWPAYSDVTGWQAAHAAAVAYHKQRSAVPEEQMELFDETVESAEEIPF